MFCEKNIKKLILSAKNQNKIALEKIINDFEPLLVKNSFIDGDFNNDCYQSLILQLIKCVYSFEI
ncbi:MAG: helix-turn-helix domain-containing protein [Peptostreptococcaceae bacterium]|jgi:hypothetical protein|nr:helix-turn-helix domain-containing protein [Peptostreptococcaceae bacterium]